MAGNYCSSVISSCAPPLRTVMVLCGGLQCADLDIILYGGYSSFASLAAASKHVNGCVALCNFSADGFLTTCVFACPMCSCLSTRWRVARWLQAWRGDAGSSLAQWMELQIMIHRYAESHADRFHDWFSSIGEVLQMLQRRVTRFPAISTSPPLHAAIVSALSLPERAAVLGAVGCQPADFTGIMLPRKWLSYSEDDSFLHHVCWGNYWDLNSWKDCSAMKIVLELVSYSVNTPGPGLCVMMKWRSAAGAAS